MVLTTIVSASYQNLQKKMAGKKNFSGKFHRHERLTRLLSTFRTTLLRTGSQVRDASNTREVQVGGGCCPKNPGLFMVQTLDRPQCQLSGESNSSIKYKQFSITCCRNICILCFSMDLRVKRQHYLFASFLPSESPSTLDNFK